MASLQAPSLVQCNHLIVVCCHAIYSGGPDHGTSEDEWSVRQTKCPDEAQKSTQLMKRRIIEPFQKGETPTFTEHLKAGLKALEDDPYGLLVLSGGPTKQSRTELSEGQSYLDLAKDNNYFRDHSAPVFDASRVIAETRATDSYQNVLFSLIHFKAHTGVFPWRVTVVTHEFKRARFMECHFPAVGLVPIGPQQVRYQHKAVVIGINPPESVTPSESLTRGERMNGIGLWKADPYGVNEDLGSKRNKRGWLPQMVDQFSNMDLEDVVLELLRYDGGRDRNEWFSKREYLPWSYFQNDGTKQN
ncbi:unnamed protein product [Penicillium salamii]|uniref:DUF218 domain-containing protein n=1 Tax=Penicillium salamii TaxID=1612424 RepID=A0A9W4JNA0_9EURO|nr:unnamed protein product [Penicillium salamii]